MFDVVFALILLVPLGAVMIVVAVMVLAIDGRPVFFGSERMRFPDRAFTLWKFRTMRTGGGTGGVSGGDKAGRVTPLGRFLRKSRLDELPQFANILRGDMSFVGPRPPLREYVEAFPGLYAEILQARPGVTGLASLLYHRHEDRILAACRTAEETDRTYRRRCVPRKAALDQIYLRRQSLCFDVWIIARTVAAVFRR
jgi:lipopolysaccharide/colanic/teichoic acid biosynthesis glycosyltransferase